MSNSKLRKKHADKKDGFLVTLPKKQQTWIQIYNFFNKKLRKAWIQKEIFDHLTSLTSFSFSCQVKRAEQRVRSGTPLGRRQRSLSAGRRKESPFDKMTLEEMGFVFLGTTTLACIKPCK